MGKSLADIIGNTIFEKTLDTLLKPSVPVANADAEKVAAQVTKEIKPVVVNATNSEPWYQSRIFRGLIVAGAGYLGSKLGLVIGEGDVTVVVNAVAAIIEAGGIIYAAYGRIIGSSKKPLGA